MYVWFFFLNLRIFCHRVCVCVCVCTRTHTVALAYYSTILDNSLDSLLSFSWAIIMKEIF